MSYKSWIRSLLVVLLIYVAGAKLIAQQRVEVELIDKSIYSGPVYQSIDSMGVHVMIEGSEVVIPHHRIRNIRFIDSGKSKKLKDSIVWEVEKGYYHTFGMGLSFGNATPGLTAGLINGYQWNRFIGTGIGVGYEMMDDISTIPLFLELKGFVKRGKVTPFYFLRPGYGILHNANVSMENRSEQGGKYWHAGVGYQFNFEDASMAISIGHLGQDALIKYSYTDWWSGDDTYVTEKRMKRRIALRIEITF